MSILYSGLVPVRVERPNGKGYDITGFTKNLVHFRPRGPKRHTKKYNSRLVKLAIRKTRIQELNL